MHNLTDTDFADAARLLAVDVPTIQAVAIVETAGKGFLDDGRPDILYEAHIFSRLTGGKWDATHPNISAPKWNRGLYGKGGAHQYERLAEAIPLDADAALKACSWGLFQILGENHQRCGYQTIAAFVEDMDHSAGLHLMAFCRFVAANKKMLAALRSRDWPTFARLYNGPDYASNKYDTKLADAYANLTTEHS